MIKYFLALLVLFGSFQFTYAKDVHVKGYYRKNGTYVRPHVRSAPDSYKWNNYGSSGSSYTPPKQRDADRDGIPNYQDHDDDNNGISDDYE